MNPFKHIFMLIISSLLLFSTFAQSQGFSEGSSTELDQENLKRTQRLIEKVEEYLKAKDAYVAIIGRRGSGDPKTGVSDTDDLDLSGMAHCGFVIRNGFGKNAEFITFNLVRIKDAKKSGGNTYDLSQLRVWSLAHFFIGTFEKDAAIFLPPKKVQLQLWNMLLANGQLDIKEHKSPLKDKDGRQKKDKEGQPLYRTINEIQNGAFPLLHNPEYNLLSDYLEDSSQNCNEHLLKTYIGMRDHWNYEELGFNLKDADAATIAVLKEQTTQSIGDHYQPRKMVLSKTKSTFAFTQNIRFGESYKKAPSFLGLKLRKEKFNVVSVDSFCDPKNQSFLGWEDFAIFRENHSTQKGWYIENKGRDYVKVNRISGKENRIKYL